MFSASSSTKSQLHQPPQDNSCSAHQQPRMVANKHNKYVRLNSCKNAWLGNNLTKDKDSPKLPYFIFLKIFKKFLKKYGFGQLTKSRTITSNSAYVMYNSGGCTSIIPLRRFVLISVRLK